MSAGFDDTLGIEYQEITPTTVVAHIQVRPDLLNERLRLHGGVLAAMAEAMASLGTLAGVDDEGKVALGMSVSSTVLTPVAHGRVEALAQRIAADDESWIWSIESKDDDGTNCAIATVTVAVRPRPAGI